jgi:hypothetical protein
MYTIDFYMLEKLIEACWSGFTILDFSVLQRTIDIHFYEMSPFHRRALFNYFSKKYSAEGSIMDKDTETIRRKLIERYNPQNQFYINGEKTIVYFLFEGRYFANSRESILATDDLVVESVSNYSNG